MAAHPRFIHRWAMRGRLGTIATRISDHPSAIRLVQLRARTACFVAATATARLPLAGRRCVTGIPRRAAAPCDELISGSAPSGYSIDRLNECVPRIASFVSIANWRASSCGAGASDWFGGFFGPIDCCSCNFDVLLETF